MVTMTVIVRQPAPTPMVATPVPAGRAIETRALRMDLAEDAQVGVSWPVGMADRDW